MYKKYYNTKSVKQHLVPQTISLGTNTTKNKIIFQLQPTLK